MSLEITYEQNLLVKDPIKTTASCFRIWFADIHLWIQQTKHLQCVNGKYFCYSYYLFLRLDESQN